MAGPIVNHMTNSGPDTPSTFVAVDIGNARIKLGLFARCRQGLPEPVRTLPLVGDSPELGQIEPWLADDAREGLPWWIASVNRPATTQLVEWLHTNRPGDRITLLASGDLPLEVRLPRPDMVGIDRLVDAVAVNRLREAGRPAVIVDVGSAITVDLVSADGAFLGGAILPGIAMSARAMHEFTDLLPLLDISELAGPPPALGTATEPAMQSGLFWGTLGAIRELIEQLHKTAAGIGGGSSAKGWGGSSAKGWGGSSAKGWGGSSAKGWGGSSAKGWGGSSAKGWGGSLTATPTETETAPTETAPTETATATEVPRPQVFLTGGAGTTVAELLGPEVSYVPHLTLAGIALAAIIRTSRLTC